ncbi:hypothetical protein ABIE58_003590 [Roseovarius sp. MBR-78]|jgi:hypothetical protein
MKMTTLRVDLAKRMTRRDPPLKVNIAEQRPARFIRPTLCATLRDRDHFVGGGLIWSALAWPYCRYDRGELTSASVGLQANTATNAVGTACTGPVSHTMSRTP